jgi:hypothetical protein
MMGSVGFVFLADGHAARLVAAMGQGGSFEPLERPEFRAMLGKRTPADYEFTYHDLNGNGEVEPAEVTLAETPALESWRRLRVYGFDHELGLPTSRLTRFEPAKVLPNGTPLFEERAIVSLRAARDAGDVEGYDYIRKLRGGGYFVKALRKGSLWNGVVGDDGRLKWRYPVNHEGVQSLKIYPWRPGWVVHQFIMIGNEFVKAGDLGEIFVMNSNCGQWNVWTADGMLASQIFLHKFHPEARTLSFPEHDRGMAWPGLTMGQEHFSGSFTMTEEDGRTYVVCGHNHISIAEVGGWERFRRLSGEIDVTPEDLRAARAWELDNAAQSVFVRAPLIRCFRGDLKSVRNGSLASILPAGGEAFFNMAYDDKNLYLCYTVNRLGPLRNTGNDDRLLFKTGAAADFMIGVAADAPTERDAAVKGDHRILMTVVDDRPKAVLYSPVEPAAAAAEAWEVYTPAGGRASFDRVVVSSGPTLYHEELLDEREGHRTGYRLTAVVPQALIGLQCEPGKLLRMDWGILVSDNGADVKFRQYWGSPETGTSDAPQEARLHPNLWGYVRFEGEETSRFSEIAPLLEGGSDSVDGVDMEGFLDELRDL